MSETTEEKEGMTGSEGRGTSPRLRATKEWVPMFGNDNKKISSLP